MFTKTPKLPIERNLFLSLISGSEAGIATTTAIIAGLATGTDNRNLVLLSAFVTLIVQAFNSAAGHITTSHVDDEIEQNQDMDRFTAPITESFLQFLIHIASSLMVLVPIVFVDELVHAVLISVSMCIFMLFNIGFFIGRTVRHTPWKDGFTTALLGGLVVLIGASAGLILHTVQS